MARATAAPPVTASEPPSQKSFCTSTITSARMVCVLVPAVGPVGASRPRGWAVRCDAVPSAGFIIARRAGRVLHWVGALPARCDPLLEDRDQRESRRAPACARPGPFGVAGGTFGVAICAEAGYDEPFDDAAAGGARL